MTGTKFTPKTLPLRVDLCYDDCGRLIYWASQGNFVSVGRLGNVSYFGECVDCLLKKMSSTSIVLSAYSPRRVGNQKRVSPSYLEVFAQFLRLKGVEVRVVDAPAGK